MRPGTTKRTQTLEVEAQILSINYEVNMCMGSRPGGIYKYKVTRYYIFQINCILFFIVIKPDIFVINPVHEVPTYSV